MKSKKIPVTVEWNELGGFSAQVEGMSVFTYADTLPELQVYLVEALNLAFEEQGRTVTAGDIQLNMQLATFFKHHNVLKADRLAARIKMSKVLLSQYVTGEKKPSQKQMQRILEGIHDIGRELLQVQFAVS